jgi:hypothetical protein
MTASNCSEVMSKTVPDRGVRAGAGGAGYGLVKVLGENLAGVGVLDGRRLCPMKDEFYVICLLFTRARIGAAAITVNGVSSGKSLPRDSISAARTMVASARVASSMAK